MQRHKSSTDDLVQIGVLAERVGLSLRTVRYYEEIGLVTPSGRSAGGFRMYGPEQEARLHVLKTMKPLGFTLDEMRELIQLIDDALKAHPGSKRAAKLLSSINAMREEISLRRANLAEQIAATQQLTTALDRAAEQLSER